jgi:hypothetical protein
MSIFTNAAARSAEESGDYTRAVIGLLEGREPVEVLRATAGTVRRLVEQTPAALLGIPESKGKWSIRMVAQHLADAELVWGWRLRMVLAHERPPITGYDQDAWATRLRYDEIEIEDALGDFERLRASNLRLLSRMSGADRDRVGVHAERGEESIAHMMRLYAGHDILHIRQIERIRGTLTR